jgi:hypothetical protein
VTVKAGEMMSTEMGGVDEEEVAGRGRRALRGGASIERAGRERRSTRTPLRRMVGGAPSPSSPRCKPAKEKLRLGTGPLWTKEGTE